MNIRLNDTCFDSCVYKPIGEYITDSCCRFSHYSSKLVYSWFRTTLICQFKVILSIFTAFMILKFKTKFPAIWCTLF